MDSCPSTPSAAHRKDESARALDVGKIPIFCERSTDSSLPQLTSSKFVVMPTMRVDAFARLLSERVAREVGQRIILFVGGSIVQAHSLAMSDFYRAHHHQDGYLYVTYAADFTDAAERAHVAEHAPSEVEDRLDAHSSPDDDAVRVICERGENSTLSSLASNEFTVPPSMTVGSFVDLLRERLAVRGDQPLHLFLGQGRLTARGVTMAQLYRAHRSAGDVVRVAYSEKATEALRHRVGTYKACHTREERRAAASEALAEGKVPIICERREDTTLKNMTGRKFVVSPTLRVEGLVASLRERVTREVAQACFLFIDDSLLTARGITAQQLYDHNKDEDGLLYLTYAHARGEARHMGAYECTHPFAARALEAQNALATHSVPVICEAAESARSHEIDQKKFLVQQTLETRELVKLLKQRVAQGTGEELIIFVDGQLIDDTVCHSVEQLYKAHKGTDQLLYITYSDSPSPAQ